MGVTDTLAKYVVEERFDNLPGEVVQRAKQMILDNIGCAFGGYITEGGKILIDFAREIGGNPETTVIGDGTKVSSILGAGVNAQLANILDFDETGPRGHPGASICQTAIAMGEKLAVSGKKVIEAFVTGYEAANRIQVAGDLSKHHQRKTLPNSYVVFGPAIAAAKLLNLNHQQVKHTIGIAGGIAPQENIRRMIDCPSHMIKNGNLWHCWTGIGAALLAQRGFTGPYDYLDGENGYWAMLTDTVYFDRIVDKLGEYYYTLEQLQLKPWPTCRWSHPAIELLLDIIKEQELSPDDIEEIKYKSLKIVCSPPYDNPEPKNMWDAFWSVPFPVALAVLGYESGPDWYARERFDDPAVLSLARKVKLETLPEAEEAFLERFAERLIGEVDMRAKGKVYTKRLEGIKGDPQRPMSQEEVNEKFTIMAKRVISEKQAEDIIKLVDNLEDVEDIREVTTLFKP